MRLLFAALLLASAITPAEAARTATTQRSEPCNSGTYDYATINAPCVWDGRHRPGPDTRSFVVNRYADLYYIRHVRAHCMLRAHEAGACPGGKR